jgi:hypothetical protein
MDSRCINRLTMFVYRSIIVLFSTNTTLIPVRWDEWKILSHFTENYNRAGSLPHMNTRCTDFLHWQWRVDLIQASSPVSRAHMIIIIIIVITCPKGSYGKCSPLDSAKWHIFSYTMIAMWIIKDLRITLHGLFERIQGQIIINSGVTYSRSNTVVHR